MSKPIDWLLAEIDRWTAEAIISPTQAQTLRSRYGAATNATAIPWGLIVFSCAGAVVVGLGVILLIAYNWDDLPKAAKLVLTFGAVAACHGGGFALQRQPGWRAHIGEALCLLGSVFFGAGIWLVAQIYHINEHYPDGFLYWAIGTLVLAWAMESTQQAILATVLFAIWGCAEAWEFEGPSYWAILIIAVGIGPLVWRRQSAILITVVLAAISVLCFSTAASYGGGARAFTFMVALTTIFIALGRLLEKREKNHAALAPVLHVFGFSGFLVCCYLLSFHEVSRNLLNWDHASGRSPEVAAAYAWSACGLGLILWGVLAWSAIKSKQPVVRVEDWLCPIGLIYIFLLAATGSSLTDKVLVAVIFNLVLLGLAVMWMFRGCRDARLAPTVIGSALFALLVLARYFDLFDSLAIRGLTFVIVGGILFAEAVYFHRARREQKRGGEVS